MAYRRPFTLEQRRAATREYELFAANLRLIRKQFPPVSRPEKAFRRYAKAVDRFGSELLRIDPRRDVDALNALSEMCRLAMAEYFRVKHFG